MPRSSKVSVLLLVFAWGAVGVAHAQADSAAVHGGTAAAERAAQQWLRHVDAGAWAAAWQEAAPGLRDTVSRERWGGPRTRPRDTLGAPRSRQLVAAQRRDSLRRATSTGPFVLLTYHSTFGTDFYVETVLAVKTEEAWRIAGYEVAPAAVRPR